MDAAIRREAPFRDPNTLARPVNGGTAALFSTLSISMKPTILSVGNRNDEYEQRDQWHTSRVRYHRDDPYFYSADHNLPLVSYLISRAEFAVPGSSIQRSIHKIQAEPIRGCYKTIQCMVMIFWVISIAGGKLNHYSF